MQRSGKEQPTSSLTNFFNIYKRVELQSDKSNLSCFKWKQDLCSVTLVFRQFSGKLTPLHHWPEHQWIEHRFQEVCWDLDKKQKRPQWLKQNQIWRWRCKTWQSSIWQCLIYSFLLQTKKQKMNQKSVKLILLTSSSSWYESSSRLNILWSWETCSSNNSSRTSFIPDT